ncbi:MAG TPA: hypothetical protein VFO48_00680, partial [Vicinamibacterales bacterium]|nr:hypothetical protein [Vicinamibacterales bacterium]
GNALEIIECVEVLKGQGPADLLELSFAIAARMLMMSGQFDAASASAAVVRAIDSGAALDKLRLMIERQGGEPAVIDDYRRLPGAVHSSIVAAHRSGYVAGISAELVGRASIALGAGRARAGEPIDYGAGVRIAARVGDRVSAGDVVLNLLYNPGHSDADARVFAERAITIADAPPPPTPLLIDICTPN